MDIVTTKHSATGNVAIAAVHKHHAESACVCLYLPAHSVSILDLSAR